MPEGPKAKDKGLPERAYNLLTRKCEWIRMLVLWSHKGRRTFCARRQTLIVYYSKNTINKYHQRSSIALAHKSLLHLLTLYNPYNQKNKDILLLPSRPFPTFYPLTPPALLFILLSMRNNQHITPNKKDNELFHSRYFSRSQRKNSNPQVYRSYFRQKPFQRFYQDISALKPVSYQCPNASLLKRSYVVIDEKVSYGKPISAAQWQRLRTQKRTEPEVVTWGRSDKDLNLKIMSAPREIVPIQREKTISRSGFWCCAPTIEEGKNVLVREL